jgi:hypothetical protein
MGNSKLACSPFVSVTINGFGELHVTVEISHFDNFGGFKSCEGAVTKLVTVAH